MEPLTIKSFLKDFIIHYIAFAILFLLFDIMKAMPGRIEFDMSRSLLRRESAVMPGYITYCILFYHYFFKRLLLKARSRDLLKRLGLFIIGFMVLDTVQLNLLHWFIYSSYTPVLFTPSVIFRFIIFTAFAITYSAIRGALWLRSNKMQTEKEQAKASLQNLRARIEPHFIFNTLNSVYAMSLAENATKTAECIEELSGLFRYALLESNKDKVSVGDEIQFIEKYIHLNKIRIAENDAIQVKQSIIWDKQPAEIAPMLIISFIENAFKYGISFQRKSQIDISISADQQTFNAEISNTLHTETPGPTNGVGLQNTRSRLNLLYPGNYSLTEKTAENVHQVKLSINLN